MNQPCQREEALFDAALQLPPAERGDFLAKACAGDHQLQQRVESLLKAHKKASGILERVLENKPNPLSTQPSEKPGDLIGRYKLLQQIGEGGCGVVYMAEQQEPVRRRVALKIIKLGMDTRQVIARFEAERQALALMDHQNIAKVLDAGATETGRPYFVMELVRGTKITDHCDANNFSARQRLDLFMQVCRAIQHAHQKGIIHRDIKPSNILVTLHDGEPMPMVIDFGIAKATGGLRLTDQTVFTAFEQFLGTPAYMSPEQTQLTTQDIDNRSDIYSLGVLLYELLTSKTPFETKELLQAGLDEMLRTIREKEPARPSTRLNTMLQDELTTTAKHRQTEALKLVQLLSGDLDWIVMKCLEKNRTRRYETANGLALDIQRHLNTEPIIARPPSQLYPMQKLVLRNKNAYLATSMASLAIVAALIIGMRISRTATVDKVNRLVPPAATSATNTSHTKPAPLRVVSGVVLAGDTSRPLSNTLVRVAAPSTEMRRVVRNIPNVHEGRTDAKGRFNIQVPQAATISMDAFYPGYQSASGPQYGGSSSHWSDLPFSPGQQQEFTIKLAPALYVAGVVVDEKGRLFPKAEVESTLQFKNSIAFVKYTQTDDDGRFEIFDFPLEPWDNARGQLKFEHFSMLRSVIDDVYKLNETERKTLRVILRRGHDISGIVTSAVGRPAVQTLVEVFPTETNAYQRDHEDGVPDPVSKQQFTDAEGRFLIQGLPDGEIIVRVHSVTMEQEAWAAVNMAGTDITVNLRLEPVVVKNPLSMVTLFGMKLADVTPELKATYGLDDSTKGVLIVNPGENHQRLGLGTLAEGEYFWLVGNKQIANLREMVTELLRINAIEPPAGGKWTPEGHRGYVHIVYSSRYSSNTQHIKLTSDDVAELKKLAAAPPAKADFHARRGEWQKAAADMPPGVVFEPTNEWWLYIQAALLIANNDLDGYRQHCHRIITQFGNTQDPNVAERVVKACLILPPSAADLKKVAECAALVRSAQAFDGYRTNWHRLFRDVEAMYHLDLTQAKVQPGRITIPQPGLDPILIPVDAQNNFVLADFGGTNLPPDTPARDRAFTVEPVWQAGIVLAAHELGLDLARADVDLPAGRITLRGANGIQRVIPVDEHGCFQINWELPNTDRLAPMASAEGLLVRGLFEYRQGNFERAAAWLEKALSQGMSLSEASGNAERDVAVHAVLAMAQYQSERIREARSTLTNTLKLAETKLPKIGERDLGECWYDWIIAQTLLREAKILIASQPETSR